MSWQDSWETVSPIEGGAQGDCFQVIKKSGNEEAFFLKQLKEGGCKERRARFYLETMIHSAFQIENTTEIIDSNVQEYKNKNVNLYYVAKFVDGIRLDKYVQSNKISETEAFDIFKQLLVILSNCHSQEVIHRDVKPENIILCDNIVHLVDFGIASSSLRETETKTGQEIGNRFLRLPEFSSGSTNKRDIRSDITLACGIALYLFTNTYPRTLIDGEGSMPHQNTIATKALDSINQKVIWNAIFDRGFVPNLSQRWSCCKELLELMESMESKNQEELDSLKAQITAHANKFSEDYLNQLQADLDCLYNTIYPVVHEVCLAHSTEFNIQESATVYNRGDQVRKSQIRFHNLGDVSNYLALTISCELLGEQIVAYVETNQNKYEIERVGTNIKSPIVFNNRGAVERNILSELVQYIKIA